MKSSRKAWMPKTIRDESISDFTNMVRDALRCNQDFVVFEGYIYNLRRRLVEDVNKPVSLKLNFLCKTDDKNFWGNGKIREVKILSLEVENPEKGIFRVFFDTSKDDTGWNVAEHGLIYGDIIFLKDLNKHLSELGFKQPLEYTDENSQGKDFIHLKIKSDPEKFIQVFDSRTR